MCVFMITMIIFDFDGTIADTFSLLVACYNRVCLGFGATAMTEKEIPKLRRKKGQEVMKQLGISWFKLPFLVRKVYSELSKEIENARPIPGIKKTILQLKQQGFCLGILTSNKRENVERFLKKNGLDCFDFIHAGKKLFGKQYALKQVLLQRRLKAKDVVYVGDETRDIEAAKKARVRVIAVSWGYNALGALRKEKPDFLISKPEELIKLLENVS